MRQWYALLACAVALAGCQTDGGGAAQAARPVVLSAAELERAPGYVRPKDPQALDAAKKKVASKLKDPESARFTDVARRTVPNVKGDPTDVVCGMVNAKNSYGGYGGAKPFVYFVANADSTTTEEFVGADVVKNFCPELLR